MNILEMAMAAKMAGGNGGGTGPIDPKRLPEGYPYKEDNRTVIEWDGTTGAPVAIEDYYSAYKVSDAVVDNLSGCTAVVEFMGQSNEVSLGDSVKVSEGVFRYDMGEIPLVCVVFNGNTSGFESGIYFTITDDHYGNGAYVKKLSFGEVTIHPMAPEFLPAGVGGGGYVVNITQNSDGTYSADKTFAEVQEQIKAGNSVSAKISFGSMVYVSTTYFLNENTVVEFVVFTGVTALMSFHTLLKASDTIETKIYNVTATAT